MSLCDANKAVSLEVKNFMLNVPDVKEESITDYLVWKWRELDARFNYINVSTFTRQEESATTGADFEIELWLVGNKFHFSLVIQAKKFVKSYDAYVTKLNYPAGTQGQLTTLLAYAKAQKKLPFYFIYSIPDPGTMTMCLGKDTDSAIFVSDAHTIKEFADGKYGRRVSKNKLLKETNPFHCIFCCPLSQVGDYFKSHFSALAEVAEVEPRDNKALPNYASMLLDGRTLEHGKERMLDLISYNELSKFRAVGVYDMRFSDEEPIQSFRRPPSAAAELKC